MVDKNRITSLFPKVKGKTTKQAHSNFPIVDGKMTYEHEHGRQGFFGKVSHLYHKNPPTNFIKIKGGFFPELLDTNKIGKSFSDMPLTIMENKQLKVKIYKPEKSMEFYYKNTEGDDLWFVHEGKGIFETIYGPLNFEEGDYIVIPRGTIYRIVTQTNNNFFLLVESVEEIELPNRGLLGPNALFDPAMIETPEPTSN